MKPPGPDHPISVAPNPRRVVVTFAGRKIADTTRALTLDEATYPVVHYIPRSDVDMSLLVRATHTSECQYKGRADYYTLLAGDRISENAAWTYEQPYGAVAPIKGRLAFYRNRVDSIEELPA